MLALDQRYEGFLEQIFQEGSLCSRLYERASACRARLGIRLNTDGDDPDLVDLVEAMEAIQREQFRILKHSK